LIASAKRPRSRPFGAATLAPASPARALGPTTKWERTGEHGYVSKVRIESPGLRESGRSRKALYPFKYTDVVGSAQPVLLALDFAEEEAAWTLGAGAWTTFRRVTLPAIMPAILTGAGLSFGRALGEIGSVVTVAGNRPSLPADNASESRSRPGPRCSC
jgi:hypothetical protein